MKLFVHFDPETGELLISRPAYGDPIYVGKTQNEILAITISRCLGERQKIRSLPIPPNGFVEGTHYHIIEEEQRPTDGWFRWAWEWRNGFAINIAKARIVQMDKIREVREKELAVLDVDFMRALEVGDTGEQQRIADLKQTLRDIPQSFSLTNYLTPATLKAAWPSELPPP